MTRTEIRRVVFQDHKSSDEVARALGLLLRYGLVRQEITQTGGRPADAGTPQGRITTTTITT